MSLPTERQTREFFRLWAEGKITGDVLQEVIEKAGKLGFSQFFKKIIQQARKAAAAIVIPYPQAKVYAAIAGVSKEAKDFEAARKAAAAITDSYSQAKVYAAIAGASKEAKDFEAARKAAAAIASPYSQAEVYAAIAGALAEAMK